jgi:hypothetical protein
LKLRDPYAASEANELLWLRQSKKFAGATENDVQPRERLFSLTMTSSSEWL